MQRIDDHLQVPTRLLRGLADPKELDNAGLELEISKDMQQVMGCRSKGIMVPFEALALRAVTYGGSGSNLVATDHMSGSFIDVLRNRSVVMGLNPTVLRDLVGNVDIPRKTAGATAYWIAGDNADSITESDLTLDTVSLTPKVVGGAVTFSHKMIVQSSPDIEQMVRQDLADLIASEIDLKSIAGSGSSNQPLGILSQTGIGSTTYTNGTDPDFADIVGLETTIATANADQGTLAYLTTPAIAGTLKTSDVGTDTGQFVWSKGMMNDLAAHKTGNMSAGYVLLGDFAQLLVGFWGGIEIDADPYGSNFLKGSVTVRVLADVDIGVRHPGAFAEIHEAAP
jgi:HK97 family phage major capsid protein